MKGLFDSYGPDRNTRTQMPPLPPPKVYLQETCAKHQFIRRKNLAGVYERPERLRAAALGISAAYSRLESAFSQKVPSHKGQPFEIIKSAASVGFDHLAVKYVHGADDGAYLSNLARWAKESKERIASGALEIPETLKDLEDDLYLCPASVEAFQGGLGTVCEAIDGVMSDSPTSSRRAFVVIRPPGHHCGEDSPSGFCFVNGIAVGAAHAYIDHEISRVIIFDIDLHHGNGTQEIVCQVNSETHRDRLDKSGLRIFYGSIHDISSYPCEEGKGDLVMDASRSCNGEDGQWLENIHLQKYTTESQFWEDYETRYRKIFARAEDFLGYTGGAEPEDTIVLMSCGFDASEYESPAMNRHGCKVPTSFYHQFTRDVCAFSERFSGGRVLSVMEGGYDDRAVTSGAMAHVCGLADSGESSLVDPQWWSLANLQQLEAQTKKRKGRKPHVPYLDQWLQRTLSIIPLTGGLPSSTHSVVIPPWKPPKPVSAPVIGLAGPRKRGRPRKVVAAVSMSPSPTLTDTPGGKKRSRSREDGHPNKQARSKINRPAASTSASITPTPFPQYATVAQASHAQMLPNGYMSFSHPQGVSASFMADSAIQLRWQPPSLALPLPYPPLSTVFRPDSYYRNEYTFRTPITLPTPSPSVDVPMKDDTGDDKRRLPAPSLVDLSRHWPKGLISPSAISAASGAAYKCHTHYEPDLGGWGVRSIKNGMDQHHCFVPNHYKNGLRYLNYRMAQLAYAVDAPFRLPRSSSTTQQRERLRSLRDLIQRALLYHHAVREAIFREIKDRCYGGRNPASAKPSTMLVRLPTLDTWLLHEYVIGGTGKGEFNSRKLELAVHDHDPISLNWEEWAQTSERKARFGFGEVPSEKDAAMNKDAGISVYPVVEGMPIKPEWLRQDVEKESRKILEDPSNSQTPYSCLPWPVPRPAVILDGRTS